MQPILVRFLMFLVCSVSLLPAVTKGDEEPKGEKSEKTKKLEKADEEGMKLLKAGKIEQGHKKLLDAILPYKNIDPKDCDAQESLMVAKIQTRVCAIVGKNLNDEELNRFFVSIKSFATRSEMDQKQWVTWFKVATKETQDAMKSK